MKEMAGEKEVDSHLWRSMAREYPNPGSYEPGFICYTAVMKSFFHEFEKFIMRGNIVDLAVGVVIGTAFNAVINSLVTNVITPPFGLLLGKINFADLAIPLGGTVKISYGLFIQSAITFVITAFGLFLFIGVVARVEALAARRRQAEATNPPMPVDPPDVSILKEIRDLLKERS